MILSCHRSSNFISRSILTKLYTSVRYGKTWNEFVFRDAASKVKVTYYFKKIFVIALAILFLDRFCWNFTQVFSMARPRTISHFIMLRRRLLLLFLENLCQRSSDFISRSILTKLYSMVRPRTSSRFMMLHQRSRSLLLFLENLCHRRSSE
jgi:hypothetical protein